MLFLLHCAHNSPKDMSQRRVWEMESKAMVYPRPDARVSLVRAISRITDLHRSASAKSGVFLST
jgi:hypothetical protein